MAKIGKTGVVLNAAKDVRILNNHAGSLIIDQFAKFFDGCLLFRVAITSGNFGTAILAIGFGNFAVMRVQTTGQNSLFATGRTAGHQNGFGTGRCAIPHRCVCHIHAGDRCHLGLEFEQILQRTLCDFRLIGRIGRQEFTTLNDIVNRRRNMVAIGTGTEETWRT